MAKVKFKEVDNKVAKYTKARRRKAAKKAVKTKRKRYGKDLRRG
jgi:hypothetical protein